MKKKNIVWVNDYIELDHFSLASNLMKRLKDNQIRQIVIEPDGSEFLIKGHKDVRARLYKAFDEKIHIDDFTFNGHAIEIDNMVDAITLNTTEEFNIIHKVAEFIGQLLEFTSLQ